MHGAVAKVEIDQALIRDSHIFRDGLEIGNRITIPRGKESYYGFTFSETVAHHD